MGNHGAPGSDLVHGTAVSEDSSALKAAVTQSPQKAFDEPSDDGLDDGLEDLFTPLAKNTAAAENELDLLFAPKPQRAKPQQAEPKCLPSLAAPWSWSSAPRSSGNANEKDQLFRKRPGFAGDVRFSQWFGSSHD